MWTTNFPSKKMSFPSQIWEKCLKTILCARDRGDEVFVPASSASLPNLREHWMLATINWFDKKMEIDFFMFNTHTGPSETSLILYFHVCLGSVIFYNVTFDKCLWIIIVHRHVQTVHGFLTSMCCNITTRIKYMKISNLTQI